MRSAKAATDSSPSGSRLVRGSALSARNSTTVRCSVSVLTGLANTRAAPRAMYAAATSGLVKFRDHEQRQRFDLQIFEQSLDQLARAASGRVDDCQIRPKNPRLLAGSRQIFGPFALHVRARMA